MNEAYINLISTPQEEVARIKELEIEASKDAWSSYMYALHTLDDRFELGEPAIATDALYSLFYSKYVIGGRFELGESALIESKYWDEYTKFLDNNR